MLHDFTHMQNIKTNSEADHRLVVTRGEGGGGRAKWVKEVNCKVTNGNQTCGGEHAVVYGDVEL